MFSSAKFLSPIVTAGLPTPGPLLAAGVGLAAVVAAGALAVVLDELLLLLLPHAVSTTASTVSIAIGTTFSQALPRIRCLLYICFSIEIIDNPSCRRTLELQRVAMRPHETPSTTASPSAEGRSRSVRCASFSPRGVTSRC